MKKLILAFVTAASTYAMAATESAALKKIEAQREGNLTALVIEHYTTNKKVDCEDDQVMGVEAIKTSSDSMNEEKRVGTPYQFSANYLVIQKCFYGSTFQGVFSEIKNAVILKASFRSLYNKNGGPAAMKDLKFEDVRVVDPATIQ